MKPAPRLVLGTRPSLTPPMHTFRALPSWLNVTNAGIDAREPFGGEWPPEGTTILGFVTSCLVPHLKVSTKLRHMLLIDSKMALTPQMQPPHSVMQPMLEEYPTLLIGRMTPFVLLRSRFYLLKRQSCLIRLYVRKWVGRTIEQRYGFCIACCLRDFVVYTTLFGSH